MQSRILMAVISVIIALFGRTVPNFPVPAGIIVAVWLVKTYEFVHDTSN